MKKSAIVFISKPNRPAPIGESGILYWLKSKLFNGFINSFLTILILYLLVKLLPSLLNWAVWGATWVGNVDVCNASPDTACWPFIAEKARILFVGVYPGDEIWRPAVGGVILVLLTIASMAQKLKGKPLLISWLLLPIFGYWIIGGGLGLEIVDQSRWGGLMLSLLLAIIGIIVSIPLGILLALGRFYGSSFIKTLCVGIIELIRGVPLVTILFMATIMMPLLLPKDLVINNILRVQIGMIIFSSAYIAEVLRGGLQAVPKGQSEAALALGAHPVCVTFLIVLPQALRHVLSPLIGRCIALFKDTSLVIIIGLLDFLGMLKSSSLDTAWLGFETEAYVFGAFVYWVVCYSLSNYGRILESQSNTLHK